MPARAVKSVIGIDIGGTNLRFALVTEDGTILKRERQPTEIERGRESLLQRIAVGIAELRREAARLGSQVTAVAAGVPGLISSDGQVHSSVNLQPIVGMNLKDQLIAMTDMPVLVVNDANAIAVGEKEFGAGKPFSSLLMLTLGTGVGSGLILNGQLWTGADGIASECGHATVEPDGRPCPCGNRGCLEQYASAGAIVAAMQKALVAEGAQTFAGVPLAALTANVVASAAQGGDALALAVYAEAGRYLGVAGATVANLLNLEAIILGGGVAASFDLLLGPMQHEILARAFAIPASRIRIVKGVLGDDAGLLGSAALALRSVSL